MIASKNMTMRTKSRMTPTVSANSVTSSPPPVHTFDLHVSTAVGGPQRGASLPEIGFPVASAAKREGWVLTLYNARPPLRVRQGRERGQPEGNQTRPKEKM